MYINIFIKRFPTVELKRKKKSKIIFDLSHSRSAKKLYLSTYMKSHFIFNETLIVLTKIRTFHSS